MEIKRCQLMRAAKKRCGPAMMENSYWYSTELQDKGQQLNDAKRHLRIVSLDDKSIEAKAIAIEKKNKAIIELKEVQQKDKQFREDMIKALAKKRAKPWKMKEENALKVLINAEKVVTCSRRSKPQSR